MKASAAPRSPEEEVSHKELESTSKSGIPLGNERDAVGKHESTLGEKEGSL